MDVVIIPPPNLGSVYEDNRIWARQFVAADPGNRAIVELARADAQAVVEATERAARLAGGEGRVIYAVGHGGGSGADHPEAGQADLGPRRVLRVTQAVAFYEVTTSWTNGAGEALPAIGRMDTELQAALAERQPGRRRAAMREWCRTYPIDPRDCAPLRAQVLDRPRVQPHYEAIARIYRTRHVRRVVLLTCNVGNAPTFLNEVATDFGVPVMGYTRRVMSRNERRGGQTRVWMFLEGDAPGQGTNTDAAQTELIPGAGRDDIRTGRVLQSRARR